MRNANRRFVLKARPEGIAGPEHFTEEAVAVRSPEPGEVLLETMYVSVDPAMRVWVSGNPGYVPRVEIGEVMRAGGIARVVESRAAGFAAGDLVRASVGWQSHPTLPAQGIEKLDLSLGGPLDWLGLLGLTGKTGYFGMREVGAVRPGETVLVSGAAGGVGQIAGQVARIEECRVVGIAGGVDKCAYLAKDLGFDAAIDYKAEPDLTAAIARACPNGVDVFFDNVGGPTLDAALANLRVGARVVICGRVSQTAIAEFYGVRNLGELIGKRARLQGFVVFDCANRYPEAHHWLATQNKAGRLHQRMHVLEDLGRAPEGLGMPFRGENLGKLAVQVSAPAAS
jgi:NADPH-dependent curcumin reductase